MQTRFSWGRLLLLLAVIGGLVGGGIYIAGLVSNHNNPAQPAPPTEVSVPGQPSPQPDAMAKPGVNPTAIPNIPAQPTDNTNPDTRPVIMVAEDEFGSYFIVQQMAQDPSLPFQLNIVPFGFNADLANNLSEQERGAALLSGQYDVLLTTYNSVARLGNIGKMVAFIDQSYGADKVVVKNIGANGLPITTFNDLAGKNICVANGNVNHFAILAALRVAGIDPNAVTWVKFNTVPQAVDAFIAGQCDVVGAWEPEAGRAVSDGNGRDFVDSAWWNNISDVIMVSNQALAEKPDLMYAFTVAWMKYAKMQSEDLKTAGEQIAAWTYQDQPTNDWTFIYPGSEESDMHLWLDTIAQAGLVENLTAFQNIGYFKLQLSAARDAWSRAGMIVDLASFNPDTLVYPDFIMRMANDSSLINSQPFANANFQPVPEEMPNAEVSELLGVSTIVKLPCETFTFKPNSNQLSDVGKTEVQACATAARDMILSSLGQILITGSSAWPAGYNEQQIADMATARSAAVYQEFIRMGVPASRIAVYISLPPTGDRGSLDESINSKYRFVRIEIKVAGR